MKKEYFAPLIKTEPLATDDALSSSTPDNMNIQMSEGYEQTSLFREMLRFNFDFTQRDD